jgi:hypothetical protein
MGRAERLARNAAIAEKFYDGYHGSVERGFLNQAFDPDDFAEEWIFCSPYLGGESTQGRSTFLADGAVANHNVISQKIPDYKMDDLHVLTLDEFTKIDHYGFAPWNPAPTMTLHTPDSRPFAVPPVNDRVARNLTIAESFFDGYQRPADDGSAGGFEGLVFADDWVLFSPWTGEIAGDPGADFGSSAAADFRKIATRLPDMGVDDFEAWPTDDGCAWRWRVHGHSSEGTAYELWEQVFMLTDDLGRITRLEFFDDWQSFPQMMGFVTNLSIDELATSTRSKAR